MPEQIGSSPEDHQNSHNQDFYKGLEGDRGDETGLETDDQAENGNTIEDPAALIKQQQAELEEDDEILQADEAIFERIKDKLVDAHKATRSALIAAGLTLLPQMSSSPEWIKESAAALTTGAIITAWVANRRVGNAEKVARFGAGEEVDLPRADRDLDPEVSADEDEPSESESQEIKA